MEDVKHIPSTDDRDRPPNNVRPQTPSLFIDAGRGGRLKPVVDVNRSDDERRRQYNPLGEQTFGAQSKMSTFFSIVGKRIVVSPWLSVSLPSA
jgi:hypothetical protein